MFNYHSLRSRLFLQFKSRKTYQYIRRFIIAFAAISIFSIIMAFSSVTHVEIPATIDQLFNTPFSISIPNASYKIYANNLFGDARPEIIFSQCDDAAGDTNIVIYGDFQNNKFNNIQTYQVSCPASLIINDFNSDGFKDIVGVSNDGQGPLGLFILYGNRTAGFNAPQKFLTEFDWDGILYEADFNNDGYTDFAAPYYLPGENSKSIKFISGEDFTVQAADLEIKLGSFHVLFFDEDRFPDILLSHAGMLQFLKGKGNFGFSLTSEVARPLGHNYGKSFMADANEDGRLDIGISYQTSSGEYGVVFVYPPHIDTLNDMSLPGQLAAVKDFDHDGHVDLLTYVAAQQQFALVKGRGDGTFDAGVKFMADNPQDSFFKTENRIGPAQKFVTGDFNGDGKKDLLSTQQVSDTALLWLGR